MAFKKTMNSVGMHVINARTNDFGVGSRFNFCGKIYTVVEVFASGDQPMRRAESDGEQDLFDLQMLQDGLKSGSIKWT